MTSYSNQTEASLLTLVAHELCSFAEQKTKDRTSHNPNQDRFSSPPCFHCTNLLNSKPKILQAKELGLQGTANIFLRGRHAGGKTHCPKCAGTAADYRNEQKYDLRLKKPCRGPPDGRMARILGCLEDHTDHTVKSLIRSIRWTIRSGPEKKMGYSIR